MLRFFAQRHYGRFRVFSLCDTAVSSDGVTGNYHPRLLLRQVRRIPFEVGFVDGLAGAPRGLRARVPTVLDYR